MDDTIENIDSRIDSYALVTLSELNICDSLRLVPHLNVKKSNKHFRLIGKFKIFITCPPANG
ncbi:hypothetical protein PV327_003181 [Microctonus hyperodae]|uniref:Uncharacterized protein n=1 Tax=Microctonus hyperodae TaxID=165561 RepID=A0AA39G3H6_MICHY|nr:hypothetical protein PV327_003181 [Microctonus hyperodae]